MLVQCFQLVFYWACSVIVICVPSFQKRKRSKVRRRTKESGHKEKKKKIQNGSVRSDTNTDVVMINDSDEDVSSVGDKETIGKDTETVEESRNDVELEEGEVEVTPTKVSKVDLIQVDSSDSLGTGESEMESEPESGELESSSLSESECETDSEVTAEQTHQDQEEAVSEETGTCPVHFQQFWLQCCYLSCIPFVFSLLFCTFSSQHVFLFLLSVGKLSKMFSRCFKCFLTWWSQEKGRLNRPSATNYLTVYSI